MNAISVIHPYKHKGQWVFDDESKGLDKEPFVSGADTLIDTLTNNAEKCTIIFSGKSFPSKQYVVKKTAEDGNDGTYYDYEGFELWLCPALLKYFKKPPTSIHFQIKL